MTRRPKNASMRVFLLVALSVISPSLGLAQENGFLVLSGTTDGPARVFIDGIERGFLVTTELTLELAAGSHVVEIAVEGLSRFERRFDVRSGDVTYLPVVLTSSTAQLRVVHLEPARVAVRIDGQVVALTPATVTVPAGQTTIGLGNRTFCFEVAENSDAYVRVRGGRIDEVRGSRSCGGNEDVAAFEAPHLPLSGGDFTRRSVWSRQRGMERPEELWPLLSGSFSHDGRLVLATLRGGQAIIWDNQTGEEVRRFRTRDDVWSSALSPNGDQVLVRFYSTADEPVLLDSHTGALDRTLRVPDQVGSVAMGFGGDVLILGSPFGYVAVVDAATGAEFVRFETRGVGDEAGAQSLRQTAVGPSPDGTRVFAVIRETSEVVIWDVETGVETLRFATNIDIADAAFSPDGQFLLTATTAPRRAGRGRGVGRRDRGRDSALPDLYGGDHGGVLT